MANLAWFKECHSVTVVNSSNLDISNWTVLLIFDDDTYLFNPAPGTHTNVRQIRVNGLAYQSQAQGMPIYYKLEGQNQTMYLDGSASQSTSTYRLDLT